ncbi:hypothetical protein K503DRAFT_794704 [Rhizopogon vinicolor AM-OR11-026]|uniref:CxC1-like cysteine cluster associated with KDZ transposases domain-containing protein n=1 Tax=Rhizopogon vinicolor AM-OR11-026 TaxID=1314800 RepID=A0A1B7MJ53_9AGAM|nr:hypothetical protein K503DRAFT_794704 [Rhizopogon vinicolor AM-OR11-026]
MARCPGSQAIHSSSPIPLLVLPGLQRFTQVSLQCAPDLHSSLGDNSHCDGFYRLQSLAVTCVISLSCCKCSPAPLQLMMCGLFACAPVAPSLAVDIRVLELVNKLFARITPNSTAWCEALETFLNERGYKLNTKDSLRRCFSNAYHWYAVLTIMASDYVTKFVHSRHPSEQNVLNQPSTYLHSCCLLCFNICISCNNSTHPLIGVNCVCSNNPRNGHMQDSPNPMPTVFVPECDVKVMEDHVSACHRGGVGMCKQPRRLIEEVHDDYEKGMRIPVSVLYGCSESFVAADKKREKASTCFFADTGLMALLCRHDRVLWLVNMTSASKKQHYALALVKRLFEHLLPDMMVGLLYDIGCQLECSCQKWSLLDDSILSHISFGISVFHVYGHQWPCQIVYHPRKHVGFGLSDGEGCEHLWSALKHLISVLRVLGYHQWLFVLDMQVRHLDLKSFEASGQWLAWKWMLCHKKKKVALEGLREVEVEEEILREEWAAHVAHQTKPLAQRSKNKAAEAVAGVLALEKTLESHQTVIHDLECRLLNNNVDDASTFNIQLNDARAQYARRAALGISQCVDLQQLKKNAYLQVRMNAHALKARLRDRLQQQKFELEKLKRSYRNTVNELNLRSHTETSIKQREPMILKIVSTYNTLCNQLCALIHQCKAPPGAIAPLYISRQGIFQLDVDNEIWQDVGLEGEVVDLPPWLANDNVCQGIRLLLDHDRCVEEENRLSCEHCVMQEWMITEWTALQSA